MIYFFYLLIHTSKYHIKSTQKHVKLPKQVIIINLQVFIMSLINKSNQNNYIKQEYKNNYIQTYSFHEQSHIQQIQTL